MYSTPVSSRHWTVEDYSPVLTPALRSTHPLIQSSWRRSAPLALRLRTPGRVDAGLGYFGRPRRIQGQGGGWIFNGDSTERIGEERGRGRDRGRTKMIRNENGKKEKEQEQEVTYGGLV
jgi:hypothetical protein